jgi:glutathione S-transferase
MKLYYTNTSPFVRKVMVVAHETGLLGRIETAFLRPSPLGPDPILSRENPLSKIPVLITDDGLTIYDSAVICEYLDGLHQGKKLIPASGPERWRVLRLQALADGILEAGVAVLYERTHRPKELHFAPWLDGQLTKVTQGLDALEGEVQQFGGAPDLAQIAVGCTVGWIAFRELVPALREGRRALFAWYDTFSARQSMKATVPTA